MEKSNRRLSHDLYSCCLLDMEVDEEDEVVNFTGQRTPPLYEWIKGVLDRYPGGQIFKVAIHYYDIV